MAAQKTLSITRTILLLQTIIVLGNCKGNCNLFWLVPKNGHLGKHRTLFV